jgi:hypothetical protein
LNYRDKKGVNTVQDKYSVYAVNPSNRQLKYLKEMHSALPRCLSMTFPYNIEENHATLRDSNNNIPLSHAQQLFFGPNLDGIDPENSKYLKSGKKNPNFVSTQYQRSDRKIVFVDPLQSLKSKAKQNEDHDKCSSIILDIPLGTISASKQTPSCTFSRLCLA